MPSNTTFVVGEVARIDTTIKDATLALVDPAVLQLKIKDGAGVVTTIALGAGIVKDAVGTYHAEVPLPVAGTWYYRWIGTGANAGADEGSFSVTKSRVE